MCGVAVSGCDQRLAAVNEVLSLYDRYSFLRANYRDERRARSDAMGEGQSRGDRHDTDCLCIHSGGAHLRGCFRRTYCTANGNTNTSE